jgi:hypothetical protein
MLVDEDDADPSSHCVENFIISMYWYCARVREQQTNIHDGPCQQGGAERVCQSPLYEDAGDVC